jgi:hypothetical protein
MPEDAVADALAEDRALFSDILAPVHKTNRAQDPTPD